MKYFFLTLLFSLKFYSIQAQTTDVLTGLNTPYGLAIEGDDLYVALDREGKVAQLDLSLNAAAPTPNDVATGLHTPGGLVLDGTTLYVAEIFGDKITKIDLQDANATPVDVVTGLNRPVSLAIRGNELYIAELSSNKVSKIDLTETNPIPVDVVTNLGLPVALSVHGDDLYVAEYTSSQISKVDLTASTLTTTPVLSGVAATALTTTGNDLYAAVELTTSTSKIVKLDLTNSIAGSVDVVTGLARVNGMAFKGADLYIAEAISNKISKYSPPVLSTELVEEAPVLQLFPNPTTQFVQVTGLVEPTAYFIYTLNGTIALQGTLESNQTVDVQALPQGVYLLQLEGQAKPMKFVKQ